jgi:drug/metabolite transporter, DME family
VSVSTSSSASSSTSIRAGRHTGVPLLVLAGVSWGTGGLLGSLLGHATGLTPLAVAAYRLGLGGLLVLLGIGVSLVRRGRRRLLGDGVHRRAALTRIATLAALTATFQASYFTAVGLTSVGLATLVTIGVAPVVVTAVEAVRGRARPGSSRTLVLALVGLALLVGVPQGAAGPLAALAGTAAAVLAGTGFAVMTLLGARPVPGLDATFATGAAFVGGGLVLAVPAILTAGLSFPMTATGVGLLALLAAVPTALAYTAYFRGLHAGAGTAAVLALLEPLTATGLAAVVLGERLGAVATVGALVLAVAVLRAARADRDAGQPRGRAVALLVLDGIRRAARRRYSARARRSAAGVDRRREAMGGGGSGGPVRGFHIEPSRESTP